MNKKKVLLVVLAMVLVCALSVMGTMALLAEKTAGITNTFVAATNSNSKFVDTFEIKEFKAVSDAAGNYSLTADEVESNSYTVTPGVTLPKDAFVKLDRENSTPAYLFVEVVNKLDASVFTMGVDSAWAKLDGVTGVNGGQVYVLGTATAPTILGAVTDGAYHIIAGNKVTVAADADVSITAGTNDTVVFYAYICQATVANADGTNTSVPAEVFDICF